MRAGAHHRSPEDGAYSVLFLAVMVVLVALMALVVDLGSLYVARHNGKAVADMAATAGGLALEPTTGGTPAAACSAAMRYALVNLPDAASPTTTDGSPADLEALDGSNPCTGFPDANSCPPVSPTSVSVLAAPYTISVTWPVPDDAEVMDERLVEDIDGTACQRLGTNIVRDQTMRFARFGGGPASVQMGGGSVARAQSTTSSGDLVALALLEREACRALTTSGQGNVFVEATTITDDEGESVEVPGTITVDSSGTLSDNSAGNEGNCTSGGNDTRYAIAPSGGNENSYIIAENTGDGIPGVILSHAELVGGASHSDSLCGPNGSNTATTPIQPCPVGGNRVTRAPIDHRYNCKASYPAEWDIAGCPEADGTGDYIDQLQSSLSGDTEPGSGAFIAGAYDTYPREGNANDSCTLDNSSDPVELGAGNWFIDCPNTGGSGNTPGLRLSGGAEMAIGPGEVVFAGGIDVGGGGDGGSLTIGDENSDSLVFIRRYSADATPLTNLEKSSQGKLTLQRTFVYLENGTIQVGAGSPTLTWVAPLDEGFEFEDLNLWSEQSEQHLLGGQGNLDVEGTFFTPNAAPFNFDGQGSQSQTRAQFVTRRLTFSGQAGLRMRPDPERSTPIPVRGVTLIR